MEVRQSTTAILLLGVCSALGCNRAGVQAPLASNAWQPAQQTQPYVAQLQDAQRRATELDANNRDLHAVIARVEQQVKLKDDELALLRQQLADNAKQFQELQTAKQEADRQVQAFRASVSRGGGAILKPNNSLQSALRMIQVPGAQARQDGDVIRVEISADQLFQPGTTQFQPNAQNLLDQVASSLARAYPRQRIGVEGHSDTSSVASLGGHQLAAAQAYAVFDAVARRNIIPASQMFVVGHGPNHPRASNATPAGRAQNRRVEFVVNPETID